MLEPDSRLSAHLWPPPRVQTEVRLLNSVKMMARMTHRERVLAAVDRQETDRTPIDFGGTLATTIVPSTYEKLKHHLGETHPPTIGWKRQQLVLPAETILRRFDVNTRPPKLGDDGGW